MAQHTEGPWVALMGETFVGQSEIRSASDEPIAAIWRSSPDDYGPANARLIAAAPDLLDALRAMVLNDRNTYRDCHKKAVAAIARATGAS